MRWPVVLVKQQAIAIPALAQRRFFHRRSRCAAWTTPNSNPIESRSSPNLLTTNLTTLSAKLLRQLHTLLNQTLLVNHVRWSAARAQPALRANKGESEVFFSRPRLTIRLSSRIPNSRTSHFLT